LNDQLILQKSIFVAVAAESHRQTADHACSVSSFSRTACAND
jgi:hypothetical protein